MDRPLRIGVVGVGAMGRNHVRVLAELPEADLVGVLDREAGVAAEVAGRFSVPTFGSLEELVREAEAAVVAVPTTDHAPVGCALLEGGLHVLVEKPLAPSLEAADRLLEAAGDRVLRVGHVEYHNPAVQAVLAMETPVGFVEVHRLGAFTLRSMDVDVILDLMIHDIQILHALDPSPVEEVRATGVAVLSERYDIANARIALASGCVANLTASRVSAERVRKLRVFLPGQGYYSVDYREQEIHGYRLETVHDRRQVVGDNLPLSREEPLRRELAGFVAACRGVRSVGVDGAAGRRALETALEVAGAIEAAGTVA